MTLFFQRRVFVRLNLTGRATCPWPMERYLSIFTPSNWTPRLLSMPCIQMGRSFMSVSVFNQPFRPFTHSSSLQRRQSRSSAKFTGRPQRATKCRHFLNYLCMDWCDLYRPKESLREIVTGSNDGQSLRAGWVSHGIARPKRRDRLGCFQCSRATWINWESSEKQTAIGGGTSRREPH